MAKVMGCHYRDLCSVLKNSISPSDLLFLSMAWKKQADVEGRQLAAGMNE